MSIFKIIKTHLNQYPVIITTSDVLYVTGLLFCTRLSEKQCEIYDFDISILNKEDIKINDPVIVASKELFNGYFTDKELEALILHEEGHIQSGHLDEERKLDTPNTYNEQKEYEADQYAVKNSTPEIFEAALYKYCIVCKNKVFIQYYLLNKLPSYSNTLSSNVLRRINHFKGI